MRATNRDVVRQAGIQAQARIQKGPALVGDPPRPGAPQESNNGVGEPVSSGAPSIQAVRTDGLTPFLTVNGKCSMVM